MSDFRKLGVPLLIIFISALITKLISIYLSGVLSDTLYKIIVVIALCVFGASLNVKHRSKSVWKKVIAVLVIIFLLFMQLNLFTFATVAEVFDFFGVGAFYINMLYILCGYLLVD